MYVSSQPAYFETQGCICLTREDFEILLDDYPNVDMHEGERHGVQPFEKVRMNLGGAPGKSQAVMNAARLGLDLENDIRVASERLAKLKHPVIVPRIVPPPIREPHISELLVGPGPSTKLVHDTDGVLDAAGDSTPLQEPDEIPPEMPLL